MASIIWFKQYNFIPGIKKGKTGAVECPGGTGADYYF